MSSQAGAWTSYVLTLGQPALTKDLVGTFDPVEDIASVGTVEEQGCKAPPQKTTGAAAKNYGGSPLSGMAGASIHVMASSPLVAPFVRISRIRRSDRHHAFAHGRSRRSPRRLSPGF
jgi:hypothetical protein